MTIKKYAGDKVTGTSSDTKPTNMPDGATFYETDTKVTYVRTGSAWVKMDANNASFLGGTAAASFVQNTDSRILSGNLNFTGANNYFTGPVTVTTNVIVGTVYTNTTAFVGNTFGVLTGNVVSNTVSATANVAVGNGSVNVYTNSTAFVGNVIATSISGNLTGNVTATNISGNLTGNVLATTVNATTINAATFQVGALFTANGTQVVTPDLLVTGNLIVNGTTVTLNTATLDVKDLNITVAKGSLSAAAANGAGLTVDGANATLLYSSAGNSFVSNVQLSVGNSTVNVTTNSTAFIGNVVATAISGNLTGNVSATTISGNLTGNVSATVVNAASNVYVGNASVFVYANSSAFVGNVVGTTVTANLTGNVSATVVSATANVTTNTMYATNSYVTFANASTINATTVNATTFQVGSNLVANANTIYLSGSWGNVTLAYNGTIFTTFQSYASVNSYIVAINQNINSGPSASADWAAYNDDITLNTFIDMGINSSLWSNTQWTINGPNDGYLYTGGGNLSIGTNTAAKYVSFFTGGTLAANERMRITGTYINTIAINAASVSAPTFTGNLTGNVAATTITGNLTGNVIATTISGNLTGNVAATTITGNLTGNVAATTISGNLTGNVTATTVSASANVSLGANVLLTTANLAIGNATANVYVNSTAFVGNTTGVHTGNVAATIITATANITFDNDGGIYFKTKNTAATVGMKQQSDDNFVFYSTSAAYAPRAVFSIYANSNSSELAFSVPARFNANVTVLTANGSVGATNQVLTSNGSTVYWSSPGAASVNTAAQYTWTNTQTFSANISFTGNGIGLTTNSSAIYLGGIGDANWKIGRNTGVVTKWKYTNNTIDIVTANSNLEGMTIGLVNGNSYFETGYLGTFIASNTTIGNSTVNVSINATSFIGNVVGTTVTANLVGNVSSTTTSASANVTVGANVTIDTAKASFGSGAATNAPQVIVANTTGTTTINAGSISTTTVTANLTGNVSATSLTGNLTGNVVATVVNAASNVYVGNASVFIYANSSAFVGNVVGTTVNANLVGNVSATVVSATANVTTNTVYATNAYVTFANAATINSTTVNAVTFQSGANLVANSNTIYLAGSWGNVTLAYNGTNFTTFQSYAGANSFIQLINQNVNTGVSASADYAAYNDDITLNTFIDMGINSSLWSNSSWTINGPNDGYVYTGGGNLSIGTNTAAKYVSIFTGGTLAVNERLRINATALAVNAGVGIFTNSSLGNAGDVLTSNGTGIYWAAAVAGANVDATYAWTNTHTFTGNVTVGNTSDNSAFLTSYFGMTNPNTFTMGTIATQTGLNTVIAGPYTIAAGNTLTITAGSRVVIV